MSQGLPPSFAAVLRNLREEAGCTQGELERKANLPRGRVSQLEHGDRTLDRTELARLVGVLGYAWPDEVIDRAAAGVALLPKLAESTGVPGASLYERRIVEASAALIVRAFDGSFCEKVTAALVADRWRREREEAARLWDLYRKGTETKRKVLVQAVEGFHTWAMCERFCAESVRAAAHDASQARELADLAVLVAKKASGEEGWRRKLQGYAWAFVGNSWRVAGNLREAESSFQSALALWAGEESSGPLDGTRIPEMLAVLRLYQRRPTEALDLLHQAARDAGDSDFRSARLLINRALVFAKIEAFDDALVELEQAIPRADASGDSRLFCVARFNVVSYLCRLGRYREAEKRLHEVQRLVLDSNLRLDLLRLRWLEAQVSAGLGRFDEAEEGLSLVWQGFEARGVVFDAALAALELAALALERGKSLFVKVLAANVAAVFSAQDLPHELIASLRLFWEAASRQAATAVAARRLAQELWRAGQWAGIDL